MMARIWQDKNGDWWCKQIGEPEYKLGIGDGDVSHKEPKRWQRKTYRLKNAVQVHEPSDLKNGSIKWPDEDRVRTKIVGHGCSQITAYSLQALEGTASTTNGWSRFWPGDWLIQFEDGNYSNCAPVTFEALYEEA